jgi:hypothetical protein
MSGEGNTAAVVRVPNFDHHNIAWLLVSRSRLEFLPELTINRTLVPLVSLSHIPRLWSRSRLSSKPADSGPLM